MSAPASRRRLKSSTEVTDFPNWLEAELCLFLARSGGQDISQALRLYECVRLPRTARIQALATHNKQQFHLPDGPEQQERDAQLASGAAGFALKAVAWLYGHDAADIGGAAMRLPAA